MKRDRRKQRRGSRRTFYVPFVQFGFGILFLPKPDPRNPRYIKTVWGGGYIFAVDPEPQ